jgi:hypothetical protein
MAMVTRWAEAEIAEDHLRNVLRVWEASTADERAQGARWYPDALAYANHLGDKADLGRIHAAAVLATASQQLDWERNMLVAQQAILRHRYIHPLPLVNAKLQALVNGGSVADHCRGDKIWSFFQNILGETQPVTVDRHAYSILHGRKITNKTLSTGEYRYAVAVYQRVARWADVAPSVLQATTWVHWRSNH